MPGPRASEDPRWYSVSVDALKGWAVFLLLVIGAVGGWLGYERWWRGAGIEREVAQLVEEAERLAERTAEVNSGARVAATRREQHREAVASLGRARSLRSEGDFPAALTAARRSRNLLLNLLDRARSNGSAGETQVISVEGRVEYRRGSGPWEPVTGRLRLRRGDMVRSGPNGSAELMFVDGTLMIVRPDSQVLLQGPRGGRDEQGIQMVYGWVDTNTSSRSSTVSTPAVEARVEENSDAFVAYEPASRISRVGSFDGRIAVSEKNGDETRTVGSQQQLVTSGEKLPVPEPLPERPRLLEPADKLEIDRTRHERLALTWKPVEGASRYALQVSHNHHFVDNVIDEEDRRAPRATLGVRGEGVFHWRVAAIEADGERGPWSPPRRFRVVSPLAAGQDDDREPPGLELTKVEAYGNIFMVEGKTEPGARVTINDEPAQVGVDGRFHKTIQISGEGRNVIEVVTRDARGNARTVERPVFVEGP